MPNIGPAQDGVPTGTLTLFEGTRRAGMSYDEVWLAQLAMGGTAGSLEVEAYIVGVLHPDAHQHNVVAQAINERFLDAGGDHPVGYRNIHI